MAQEPLKDLLVAAHHQRLVLPQFQRDFVWQPSMILKLLNSIFNGYPIGSLLLMENNNVYGFRPVDGVPAGANDDGLDKRLILDGQQRITSCYRAFYAPEESTKSAGRYYFNYDAFVNRISTGDDLDPSELEDLFIFYRKSEYAKRAATPAQEIDKGLFPLDCIFQSPRGLSYAEWLDQYLVLKVQGDTSRLSLLSKARSAFQLNYIEKVTGYQVSFELIKRDTNPDVICTIFETINTTGVKLTVFDLLVAKCFKANLRLRDQLDEFFEKSPAALLYQDQEHLEQIAMTQLPKIISLLSTGNCRRGDILSLKPDVIQQNWPLALSGFEEAIEFLSKNCGVVASWLLPSIDVVAPLAALLATFQREEKLLEKNRIQAWYWACVFGQYFSGSPDTTIAKTYRELLLGGPTTEVDAVKSLRLRASEIRDATRQTSLYKGLLALMISQGATDIGVARKLLKDCKGGELQDHHIYPQKFLANFGVKGNAANSIVNRMPMLLTTNQKIGSSSPETYFNSSEIVGRDLSQLVLDPYGIDFDIAKQKFSKDHYSIFLLNRTFSLAKLVANAIERPQAEFYEEDLVG